MEHGSAKPLWEWWSLSLMARRRLPVAALLTAVLLGSARAQAPAAQSNPPASGGLVVKTGDPQLCLGCTVFLGTDQGPQTVQDQATIQEYVQRFAGTEWSFKTVTSKPNGDSQGQVTVAKGGQALLKLPAIYFGTKQPSAFEAYEVFYSDRRVTMHARFSRSLFPGIPQVGSAQIFYTIIGDDGTPTSAWQYYPLTFSQ
jgi:hypothetical protein